MAHKVVRTAYSMYQMLMLFLAIILYCDGRVFDWGTTKQRYGLGDDYEIFTQNIEMPGVNPDADDVYMCTSVQMPRQDAYIVNFVSHATMKKAHHMLLYGCHDITSSPGKAYECVSMGICNGKSTIMFAWARDAPPPVIPRGVGFHVGGDSNINYITLQVHYGHKDAFKDGEEDHSGIELSMTYTPQPYLAGIYLMVSGEVTIRPHSHNVHEDLACGYTDPVPIYPFAFRTHTHELGKVITGYLIKGDSKGTWLEIAKGDPHWAQAFYPMQPGITVEQGDWLIARCTFSSDRDTITKVGPTGDDEMCNLYLMYYTDAEYGKPFSMCSSPATGDIKTHFPDSSDIPPKNMPETIEQPPAGHLDNPYYRYDNNDYYHYPYNDYRSRLQNLFDTGGNDDYVSENFLDMDRNNGWPNDEEMDLDSRLPTKPETEKPGKEEEMSTPAAASDKSTEEEGKAGDGDSDESKEDVGSGKLTLADWQTDDSVTLGQVSGVAVDAQGNVHVFHRVDRVWNVESFDANNRYTKADDGPITNNTVIAFNPETGKLLHQWGGKVDSVSDCLTCYNGFYLPHGLSIDHEGNLWVTDVALHQVFKFPAGGAETPLLTLGEKLVPGGDKDHFCKPTDVAVDPSTGSFFVADGYCNSRVMKFSPQGNFLMQWGKTAYGSSGLPSDAFLIPHSLTYLKDRDVICVADRENGRIQCFDGGDGGFVGSYQPNVFGGRVFAVHYNPWNGGVLYAVNGPTAERIPVQGFTLGYENHQVLQTWKPGKEEFQNPHDVECTADNTAVYVAEIGPNKVWKFDVDIGTVATDVCQPNPCFNQGKCYQAYQSNRYLCFCGNEYYGTNCQYVKIVTPTSEEIETKQETGSNQVLAKSSKTAGNTAMIKSLQTQEAGLKAQTDVDLNAHKMSATDANTATTAIIVAVLAVPIVLMMMVAVAVRLRAQGKMKFGGNGLRTGYSSTADRFSLGNFFNRRKGFNQVSTEDSDHDGGMEWSEESDIEEYSILNSKTSQNL